LSRKTPKPVIIVEPRFGTGVLPQKRAEGAVITAFTSTHHRG